ncbi:hypothetical protein NHX12_024102 [Muraenolepis orangiensis]|uniref:Uncharacterized protein n=1 Tax=Muraenolepis orangiensis TaxID=630683 RepID=A0A9Q0IQQ5_9TELE|nr:hypothetical protein NHX12_024102 [Muraenolepis orangiensis]
MNRSLTDGGSDRPCPHAAGVLVMSNRRKGCWLVGHHLPPRSRSDAANSGDARPRRSAPPGDPPGAFHAAYVEVIPTDPLSFFVHRVSLPQRHRMILYRRCRIRNA